MIQETKPTLNDCLEVVVKINEGIPNTKELLMHKARWLYMLNRLSFWNDLPVMLDIIKHEIELEKLRNTEAGEPVEQLCQTFFPDGKTTSATKCQFCEKEKWEHQENN